MATYRVTINSSMTKGRLVSSTVSQGPISGLGLIHIFISDTDNGIEHALNESSEDTGLCGAVSILEERNVINGYLDRLEE